MDGDAKLLPKRQPMQNIAVERWNVEFWQFDQFAIWW